MKRAKRQKAGTLRAGGATLGCLTLLCALLGFPGGASAAYDHGTVTGEYGKDGPASSGLGIGCHLAYRDAADRLLLFAESKVFALHHIGPGSVAPVGGAFPVDTGLPSSCGDPHLAVDNTAGPTAGNFYVAPSDENIYGFGPAGAPLGPPWPVDVSGEACGVAVTNTGEVWAGNYGDKEVTKFTAAGAPNGSIPIGHGICKIAIDRQNNDLYALAYSSQVITRYTAASGYKPGITFGPVGNGNAGFAINSTLDRLYVPEGPTIRAYDVDTGAPVETTDFEGLARSVAVDESTDTLFVADAAHGVIKELVWGPAAEVSTGSSAFAGQDVVVHGQVDPSDLITVTDCRFQFVPHGEFIERGYLFAKSVPCVPAPPFSSPTAVSATLPDLMEGAAYHYRLVAGSGQAVRAGEDRTLTTRLRPRVATTPATEVLQTVATINGVANTDGFGAVTSCTFEFVDAARFDSSGYREANLVPCSQKLPYPGRVPVSARLEGLRPGSTYHYRLTALNPEGGLGLGADMAFTTLLPNRDEEEDGSGRRGGRRHRPRIRCSKRACSRTMEGSPKLKQWESPRFPPSYGWLFSVYKDGRSLPHTRPAGGCVSTFTGRGMIATLNGCRGRFKMTYIGRGDFKIRWRVFARCRCGETAQD